MPPEVTDLLHLASTAPPIAKAALSYGLFALGVLLVIVAAFCLMRSAKRQETLNLEGTSHYVRPEKKKMPPPTMDPPTNGKGKTLETLNPVFVNGHENNGTTN